MSNKKSSLEANQKFNVYAGGGVFLSAMTAGSSDLNAGRRIGVSHSNFGVIRCEHGEIKPLALNRADAVRACYMARAQGVQSWLVAAA